METTDKRITVLVLRDTERQRIDCGSYEDAIGVVKAEQSPDNVVKIETREGEIVFTSGDMNIEDWETGGAARNDACRWMLRSMTVRTNPLGALPMTSVSSVRWTRFRAGLSDGRHPCSAFGLRPLSLSRIAS
jgi:hypothetical protein